MSDILPGKQTMIASDGTPLELFVDRQYFYNEKGELSFLLLCFNGYRLRPPIQIEEIKEIEEALDDKELQGMIVRGCSGGDERASSGGGEESGGCMGGVFTHPESMGERQDSMRTDATATTTTTLREDDFLSEYALQDTDRKIDDMFGAPFSPQSFMGEF